MLPMAANAQDAYSLSQDDQQAQPQQAAPVYSAQQIDQMVAPIALYPDQLVSTILMASTYPLEVVEAYRWQQNNPGLQGDELAQAIDQQPWDPSVKALVSAPQILKTMNDNLQWTEQLGDAFLGQQAAVSASVQRLRQQAQAVGSLASTPQQTVSGPAGDIAIIPADPSMVYIPEYNPATVYGAWPYPSYPPYYFSDMRYNGAVISFGFGFVLVDGLWGWNHWDWRHHRIDLVRGGVWQHDPDHRRGVPYHDAATRARFQGANNVAARRSFRGYQPAAASQARFNAAPGAAARVQQPAVNTQTRAAAARPNFRTQASSRPAMPEQHSAPVFESFSGRPDVHAQSMRGASSRSVMQHAAPDPRPSAPEQHGGGGDGHEHFR